MTQPRNLFCDTCLDTRPHMPGGDPLGMNCSCGARYEDSRHPDVHKDLERMVMIAKYYAKEHRCNYNIIIKNPNEKGDFSESSTYEYVDDSYFKKERPNVKLLATTDGLDFTNEFERGIIDGQGMSETDRFISHFSDTRLYDEVLGNTRKTSPIRTEVKIQRNTPCSCGSGIKYKKCCLNK